MEKLSIQEEEAMRIVWHLKKGFIKDFLKHYPQPRPPYTTLASVIKNLERKGYVQGRKYGNVYEYIPIVEECEYKKTFMSGFVKNYFKNSYRDLVAFFISEQNLSSEELKELIEIIDTEKK